MVVVIMGVTGSGKTTIGRLLARDLEWPFYDADDFHSPANVEKMRRGIALCDEDRMPWLQALSDLVARCVRANRHAVVACSALKAAYRAKLKVDERHVVFVCLRGDPAVIEARLRARRTHFMPPTMLASQLAILEVPADCLVVDVADNPVQVVAAIKQRLQDRLAVDAKRV